MTRREQVSSVYREAWSAYRSYPASLLLPGLVLFAIFGLPAAVLTQAESSQGAGEIVLVVAVQLLGFTSSALYYGYCEKIAAQAREGRGVSIRRALSNTGHVLLPLIAATVVAELLIAVGLLLLIVPGVYLALRFAVVAPTASFEHAWPRRAMRRSWELVRGHMGLALLTAVAMFALEQLASTYGDELGA